MKQNSKAKRGDCERAAQHYVHHIHNCVISRKAIRTQFQSVDFFASDIVGKRDDGSHVYVQATAGMASAVHARKKKLEAIPWHPSDTVELVQLQQEPGEGRSVNWFFKVFQYSPYIMVDSVLVKVVEEGKRMWVEKKEMVSIDRSWFKAYKPEEV